MKIEKFPPLITFRITSRCNNDCKYCFGPRNIKEVDFLELKKLFRIFWLGGAKAILLTGGEPLIRKDFKRIIQELKKYNFKIFEHLYQTRQLGLILVLKRNIILI